MDAFAKRLLISGDTSISNFVLDHFTDLRMTPAELVIYLQIKRHSNREDRFPSADSIARVTGYSVPQVYDIFHQLIEKKLMQIKPVKNKQGQDYDSYDFTLMYDKLAQLSLDDVSKANDGEAETVSRPNPTVNQRQKVFQKIEAEFGRALSPIELETIGQWLDNDNYSADLIVLALREAVLNQVYNLKYIDRILINWDKKNIRTPEAVEKELQNRESRNYNYKDNSKKDDHGPDIPMFKIK